MKTLVTGFEPFDGREINQSAMIAKELAELVDADFLELPVTFSGCFQPVEDWLKNNSEASGNSMVFSLGEAPIPDVRMEQIALNKSHAPGRGDNSGDEPVDRTLSEGSELALESDYSPEDVLEFFEKRNEPFKVSYSAGEYVCNCLFWRLLERQKQGGFRGMFFHVPVNMDSKLKESIVKRLTVFIKAAKKGEL